MEMRNGSDVFEIALDESVKNKHTIILPLSCNFKVTPLDESGKSVPVSSITNLGIKTIIETPGATSQWKVIVMKSTYQSSSDGLGTSSTAEPDENGNGLVDWLCEKASSSGTDTKVVVQNAKRRIIFQKEGS